VVPRSVIRSSHPRNVKASFRKSHAWSGLGTVCASDPTKAAKKAPTQKRDGKIIRNSVVQARWRGSERVA
jgi:hypothetical protein